MTFRETFNQIKQSIEEWLHEYGFTSADADSMGWTSMLTIEQNTRVTINVPTSLVYGDFNISGILETEKYRRLTGKTVVLEVDGNEVATTVTDIDGMYSFTHLPVSPGIRNFQVVFEGEEPYNSSASSTITKTVTKETTIMNLDTVPIQHYGDTVVLGGELIENDNERVPIVNASVKYYLDDALVSTLTTDSDGLFSVSEPISDFDSHEVFFMYEGNNNYDVCSAITQINVYQKTLTLTSDKSVVASNNSLVAPNDNAYATITAQITDSSGVSLPFANEEISFEVDDGSGGSTSVTYTEDWNSFNENTALEEEINSIEFEQGADVGIRIDSFEHNGDAILEIDNNMNDMTISGYGNQISYFTTTVSGHSITLDELKEILLQQRNYTPNFTYDMIDVTFFSSGSSVTVQYGSGSSGTTLTETTDNTGKASITYTPSDAGEVTITAEYDNITSNEITIHDYPYEADFTLTSDKNILSYVDEESCTITAQAKYINGYNEVPIENQLIELSSNEDVLNVEYNAPSDANSILTERISNISSGQLNCAEIIPPSQNGRGFLKIISSNGSYISFSAWANGNYTAHRYSSQWDTNPTQVNMDGDFDINISNNTITYKTLSISFTNYFEISLTGGMGTVLTLEKDIINGVTNENGLLSFNYESQGMGDVQIEATTTINNEILSDSISIEDTYKFYDCKTNDGNWNVPTGASVSFNSNDGAYILGTAKKITHPAYNIQYPQSYSVELEITKIKVSTIVTQIGVEGVYMTRLSASTDLRYDGPDSSGIVCNHSLQIGDIIKLEYDKTNNMVTAYVNNQLLGSLEADSTYPGLTFRTYLDRGMGVKNMKIFLMDKD